MRVFFSYSHKDEAIRNELEVHFSMLKRNGEIETWHDRRILGGEEFDEKIKFELEHADLILLLVSPYFLNSDYCYSVELNRGLQRAKEGVAHVLPVIAEVCDWRSSPLGKLKALPLDGKPLSKYSNPNDGYLEVVEEVRVIIGSNPARKEPKVTQAITRPVGVVESPTARTSNLQIRRQFSGADKDRFLFETFEYMSKFFEASLQELQARNGEIETRFRKVTANAFTCQIYRNGSIVNQCQISIQSMLGRTNSIFYSREFRENSYQESLSVGDDGNILFMEASMGASLGKSDGPLSQEGASECLWSRLIEPLQ